jgi:hypothetical protein
LAEGGRSEEPTTTFSTGDGSTVCVWSSSIGKANDVESSAKVVIASSPRLPVVKRMMIKQTACVSKDDAIGRSDSEGLVFIVNLTEPDGPITHDTIRFYGNGLFLIQSFVLTT